MTDSSTAPWDHPGRVELLKELWTGPLSCTDMVAVMKKRFPNVYVTKNAMVAKAHRLKLGARDHDQSDLNRRLAASRNSNIATEKRHATMPRERRVEQQPQATRRNASYSVGGPRPEKLPPPMRPRAVPTTETACTLLDLNGRRCSFTLDAKQDGEWLFCGAPAKPRGARGSYVLCDCHLESFPPKTVNGVVVDPGHPGMFRPGGAEKLSKLTRALRRYV